MQAEEERMQEFLINNTVNCNLMSLTGYRTLVILKALMESPKSNTQINDYLFNNEYIKEKFSSDTLRIYINSLRDIGCEITSANKSNSKQYQLISHPFTYDIPQSQLKAISKVYKNICNNVAIKEIIELETFFTKIADLVSNEKAKDCLKNISILKGINKNILNDLLIHCKNKNQIIFLYNSPKTGEKEIEIIADKLSFKSDTIYLWGNNLTHKEYSYFALDRILKINRIKFVKDENNFPPIKIIYELYNHNENYIPKPDEKIIKKTDNKLVIEVISRNEFNLMQRILHLAGDCKVIEPAEFKTKLLNKLKAMDQIYENM